MPKLEGYKRELPYAYAPGIFPSLEALRMRPACARRLLLHSAAEASEGAARLLEACDALSIRTEMADRALARLSQKENCFAALVFDKFEDALAPNVPHIVLHNPADRGNLGTILRTCLGFGLPDVAIIRPAVDVFEPHTVRASMGALFSMRVTAYADFSLYREAYPEHALFPFMLRRAEPLSQIQAPRDGLWTLVFGNEARGLPAEFSEMGRAVRIEHSDAIDSLNLSVAVAVGAYAFLHPCDVQ